MGMDKFCIAPGDLSAPVLYEQWQEDEIDEFDNNEVIAEQENAIAIRALLLPEVGPSEELWIPVEAEGKYSFEDIEDKRIQESLYFQMENGEWYVHCRRPAHLIGIEDIPCHTVKLYDRCLLSIGNVGQKCKLYIETVSEQSLLFQNYQIYVSEDISIGRSDNNDIVYKNNLISKVHARLCWRDNALFVKDCNSQNGVWVNEERISDIELKLGDRITILGLKIIVGVGFISINSENTGICILSKRLRKMQSIQNAGLQQALKNEETDNRIFNRSPRRMAAFEPGEITIEAPPMSLNSNNIPLMLRMGGSMVMGGTSALSGNYAMLLSSVLFPVLTQKYSDKEKKEYEKRRLEKYREYLDNKRKEIIKEKEYEETILKSNYPELNHVLNYPISGTQLWERRKTDEDFLNIRVGYGDVPMIAKIEYPSQHFNMDIDILEREMFELAETPVVLSEVPIKVDFIQNYVSSIEGRKQIAQSFIKRIAMMMAVLHSYDEVKMIFLAEEEDMNGELEFIKYIPHTWDDQKSMRFVASNPGEAYQIGELLKQEIENDIKKPREIKEILKSHPYYVVFALSKRIFDSMEVLKDIMQQEKTCGVSVITAFDDLPKECSILFDLGASGNNSIVYLKEISRKDDVFKIDRFDELLSEQSMKAVANTNLKNIAQAYSLPKTLTFLEMYKAGKTEHLNVTKRWTDNNPVKSLSVPVGVSTDGTPFFLDLHQKYQGPHGLVAGTTGSGKSEFLLTYILSMAINFHPDEVAFVLIDYKGGGLAGAFDDPVKGIRLPHLVGTITNLDGASIQRSLVSIQSELTRRQLIFNKVKTMTDEGTMDIYTYQKLYRSKVVSEPMPHLFIISDEFAELKQQQPEFMDQLISAARIGRSLGVHLILATQKPAGVVNDQIRSNTKFRVCLKVQDKMDSQDMLKRPEAAELKDTGRFYLQVGYNEFFALGQSGWSGAPYEPFDEVLVQKDDSVQVLDMLGQSLVEVKPVVKHAKANGTQLVAVVKMLTEIAENQRIKARNLWEPELRKQIDIQELINDRDKNERISASLGMIDDPERQKQFTYTYDFEQSQHLLITGDASSGKTLLIQSILYSLCKRYSSEQVNFYILDYSSRMLKNFKSLPHCGAVLLEDDSDRLDSFFELINGIVTERKKLFSEIGVDSFSSAKQVADIPLILVFIDNISGLSATRSGEQYVYKLQSYLKDSLNYGVKYIISCNHLNEVSSRLRQQLGDCICLHMKDKYDYSDALNCKVNYTPPEMPGRGMCKIDDRPLEIQMAIYQAMADDKTRISLLINEIETLQKACVGSRKAKRLPVVSEIATYEEFMEQFSAGRIPLGYSRQTQKPIALPLQQVSLLSVYQGNMVGRVPVLKNFLSAAKRENMNIWFIKKNKDSVLEEGSVCESNNHKMKIFESTQNVLEQLWHEFAEEIALRLEIRKSYCEQNAIGSSKEEIVEKAWRYMYQKTESMILFIENYSEFCRNLDQISIIVYDKLFQSLAGLNIYVLAFFYSDDSEDVKNNYLYSGFNIEGNAMLFGGKYDRQSMVEIPGEESQKSKTLPFNVCVMRYRSAYYPLLMPCGEIDKVDNDEDARNIFE